MKKLLTVIALVMGTTGCTAAQFAAANTIIDVTGSVCQVVVAATDPQLVPLCTTATDVANAIAALIKSHSKTASNGLAYSPSNDEVYSYLASHGAKSIKR